MIEQTLAQEVSAEVVRDTQFWIALVGLIGGVVGAVLTIAGSILVHWLQDHPRRALDQKRKALLKTLLEARNWRKLSTLSRVVGADAETTRRLLIEVGARGSEKPREDEEEVWGLISKHPLDKIDSE